MDEGGTIVRTIKKNRKGRIILYIDILDIFMNCGVLVLKKKRKVKTTIHTHTCDTISSDVVHQTELYHFSF